MRYKHAASGFTLIEMVIGIVVLSVSFSVLFQMILPAATQSAGQIHQIRAAELGQSLMSEIMGKAFDENSDINGGFQRCGEGVNSNGDPYLCSNTIGNEENNVRSLFDDVDDYDGYAVIADSLDASLSDIYKGFTLSISVIHDSNYDGIADIVSPSDTNVLAKRITITVTSAEGNKIVFASYKANF